MCAPYLPPTRLSWKRKSDLEKRRGVTMHDQVGHSSPPHNGRADTPLITGIGRDVHNLKCAGRGAACPVKDLLRSTDIFRDNERTDTVYRRRRPCADSA